MEDEKKEKGFVIKDRRFFNETGEVRKDQAVEENNETASPGQMAQQEAPAEQDDQDINQDAYLPDVNFANFILSLSTTAMYHFGDFPDPATQKPAKNLRAAKHTIDTMGMLKGKTEGNLDEQEKDLLDGLLFELRMRYVKESNPS